MISNYHHYSSDAHDGISTSPPQYTFDVLQVAEGEKKTTKSGRSYTKRASNSVSSMASDDSSNDALAEIVRFLNDLEQQEDPKRKRPERKLSSSDRSTFSAASSLAYSEGMSTLCYSEGSATPTNSEGGATFDGSYLDGTKLLGSLLGEPADESDSLDGPMLTGTHLSENKQTSGHHPDDYYQNTIESPSPPTKTTALIPVKNISSHPNTSSNGNGSVAAAADHTQKNNNCALANTSAERTGSFASNDTNNTSYNSDASTPIPAEPSPDRRSSSQEEEEDTSPRRKRNHRKQKTDRTPAAPWDEESYFSHCEGNDGESSTLGRVLCGWDLGVVRDFCGKMG